MSEKFVEVRGVRVAARTHITVGDQIEIVADEAVVHKLGAADKHDEQLRVMGRRFIEAHRLLGLDVEGLKRIIVSGRKPSDSLDLVKPNEAVWSKLQHNHPQPMQKITWWMCGESEVCQCCYCIEVIL